MLVESVAAEGFKIALSEAMVYLKSKSTMFVNIDKINIDNSYLKASNVENVKTIWQVDKTVNLNQFYYPSKLVINNESIIVDSLGVFPENGKVVIQGTAGQGKSILLRYLTGKELKKGSKIPLFIELRKISHKNDMESLIINSIQELGISVDSKNIDYIISSGKFVFLLDAFDEIPEEQLKDTISYVEGLCSKYYFLQVIITSRPNSEIQKVSYFNVYDLEELKPSDFKPILTKFFNGDSLSVNDILHSIHKSTSGIVELITTPLLLTLLTITYKSYNRIPEQLHEFYDNLFHLLINRHDSTKPGFKREYKTTLNEKQLEDLFCAFSFYCMLLGKSSLTKSEAVDSVSKAKKITNLNFESEYNFLSDCNKNTCLIVQEGFDYHFIHKSIREYHAAKFIKQSPLALKEKFYLMAADSYHNYKAELQFLNTIDDYYFYDLFLIPKYESVFKTLRWDGVNINIDFDEFKGLDIELECGEIMSISLSANGIFGEEYFGLQEIILDLMFNASYQNIINSDKFDIEDDGVIEKISILDFLKNTNSITTLEEQINDWAIKHWRLLQSYKRQVNNKKKIIDNLDFNFDLDL